MPSRKRAGGGRENGAAPAAAAEADTVQEKPKEPVVIAVWDAPTVKNTLDDAVRTATLEALPEFESVYSEEDFKLWTAGIGCLFAAVACVYGLLVPHPESADVVGVCVIGYFIMMTILNGYLMFFDSQRCVHARRKDGMDVSVTTSMPHFDAAFKIVAVFKPPKGDAITAEHSGHVGEFFYEDGELSEQHVLAAVKVLAKQCPVLKKDE